LRIRARHGQLNSVEQWRRENYNDHDASHFSVHPVQGEDPSLNTGSFPQSRVVTPTTKAIIAASLTVHENVTQCMHHRAYGDLVDDCQCEVFFRWFCQVVNFLFQTANSTSVSIALPTIEREMNLEPAQLQWIMSAYPLSSVSKGRALSSESFPQFHFQFPILCRSHMDPTHIIIIKFRVASS